MKKNLLFIIASCLLAITFTSCKDMGALSPDYFTVEPAVLEAKAGKVEAIITGKFPEKYFKKKATITVVPVIKYDGKEERLSGITFQGEKVKDNNKSISYKLGGTYTHKISFDFKPGMEKSELVLEFTAKQGKKTYQIPSVKIADGINTTYSLVSGKGLATAYGVDKFQRIISEMQEADIKFLISQTNIRKSELTAEDIVSLMNKLSEASKSTNKEIKGIEVSAYASPDGSTEINTTLAEKREKVAVDYLNKELKKLKAESVIDSKFTPEDWDGFQELMKNSSIQDKNIILNVLSMYTDPEEREKEIKKISSAFKIIADEILPQLRRSKMKLNIDVIGKSNEQILDLAAKNPSALSVEEIIYAGTLVDDLNAKAEIYKQAVAIYPNDWRTSNNLGAVKFTQGNYAEATTLFTTAYGLNPKGQETNYNMGIASLVNGDKEKAQQYFGNAAGIGEKLDVALGSIYILKGEYPTANKSFGTTTSNNAALAKILVKDYASATNILNSIKAPNGTTSYLKAIVAARTSDKEGVLSNMKTAVSKDASLAKKAAKDVEFAKYMTEPAFTAIIQ